MRAALREVEVRKSRLADVAAMRELYRREAGCQIVHDSVLPRGLADPYLIVEGGQVAGYAGVWNRYHPGRLMEFFLLDAWRPEGASLLGAVIERTGAREMEAQTNIEWMFEMLRQRARNRRDEKILFEDDHRTDLRCPGVVLRTSHAGDSPSDVEWVLELEGEVVARGGVMSHYNPPYWDIYMEVDEAHRRRGYGSFLVQELKKLCYSHGRSPGARCDPENAASHRTLERAGFRACGSLVVGDVE